MNQVTPVAKKDDHAPEEVGGVRPQTPIEVCAQIAAEHAANTMAAIAEQRAARVAGKLEDYGQTLSELAEDGGGAALNGKEGRSRLDGLRRSDEPKRDLVAIRSEVKRLVDEDRVPLDVLEDLIEQFGEAARLEGENPDRPAVVTSSELVARIDEADEPLDGDSNDAEHDALYALREALSKWLKEAVC